MADQEGFGPKVRGSYPRRDSEVIMTIIQVLSPSEAQRLTQRIKLTASSVRDGLFKLRNLVEEAKNSNAWQVLGFRSWTEYLSDTLGSEPMRLAREERQELVEYLSGEGMSTRAIAPIVGASREQVRRDIASTTDTFVSDESAAPQTMMQVDADTGEVRDVPARHVTGVNGKEYAVPLEKPVRPAAAAPSRNVEIVNDIRLYLRHIATMPEVAKLPQSGKQHIIDALRDTITALERTER
jgi:hypothetical protein